MNNIGKGVNDLKDVENFVHWEVYEEEIMR